MADVELPSVHPDEATKPKPLRASCLSYFVAALLLVLGLTEVSLRLGISIFQSRHVVDPPTLNVPPELSEAINDDSRSFFDALAFVSAWRGPDTTATVVAQDHDSATLPSPPVPKLSPLPTVTGAAHTPAKLLDPREEQAMKLEKQVRRSSSRSWRASNCASHLTHAVPQEASPEVKCWESARGCGSG